MQKLEKEIVTVRFKKLKNGNKSVYLDIYLDGIRTYEFLRLYILPETGSERNYNKRKNKETMAVVNVIKAQRVLDLKNGRVGITSNKSSIRLVDWIEMVKVKSERSSKSSESSKTIENMKKHIIKYVGNSILLSNVDKRFCHGWINYLKHATKRGGQPLSDVTRKVYLTCFGTVLNKAVREGLLQVNPLKQMEASEKIVAAESERTFLDIEEVQRMANTECYSALTKQAFMFSCFSGLRISDIRRLKWGDIDTVTNVDGSKGYRLSLVMQKTMRTVSYQLSNEAMKWLPTRAAKDRLVFEDLTARPNLNYHIKQWAKMAGITKNVSFHTARHTFATMMLTLGADIYTVSKLLGHSRVSTTEIYAKIIDKKKDEAMGLIDKFFADR
jgi:integrase